LFSTYRDAKAGLIKLIYVAPERLQTAGFSEFTKSVKGVVGVGEVKADRYCEEFLEIVNINT
jgi:superfamily II DNA helicase RecQ